MNKAWDRYRTIPLELLSNGSGSSTPSSSALNANENSLLTDLYKRSKEKQNDKDELAKYLETGIEDFDNIFDYWKINSNRWPRLAAMARDFLAPLASSASSERAFSVGRHMLGISRHSMSSTTMEANLCLRSWVKSKIVNDDIFLKGKDSSNQIVQDTFPTPNSENSEKTTGNLMDLDLLDEDLSGIF